ncbi:hypothetical protein [Motiliproteus sp. MSK22-1]|uniref:hypothetical protein n=1 Tax=Motiliproteus sp. MSK22-1 TaxID=1897630 RepID=UPI000977D1FD|nr:hypothetical protein [Motiliproteus sp. MSK22-1]OMH39493.1 hypothetical protein BGP75_02565 [Motiliproteus sp. MSK22-1]
MANFYTEDRISIKTLDDIVSRPHYEASVPPRRSLFRYVLAAYSFPRKIACCSVSDCYQNHKKGYLVRTAESGECSICENCAKRFMDPQALTPPKASRRRSSPSASSRASSTGSSPRASRPVIQSAIRHIELDTFISQSEGIKERVKELKQMSKGANWLFKSLSQFQKTYPAELFSALEELRLKKEESTVYEQLIESNATDQQLQNVEQLAGLGVFSADLDIRQLLIERILKPLKELDEKAKKVESQGSIGVPVDWSDQVEGYFILAEKLIAEAQLFFSEENLERLKSIPLTPKAAQTVRTLRWDCEKGDVVKS